jgi:nucleotide-binding universal stress UspA family protein
MKTIIVPIDFSNESMSGLELALMFANKTGASIQMVHVLSVITNIAHGTLEKEHQMAKVKFEEILQKFTKKYNNNISLNYIIKEGKIFREVTSQADSFEDSILILSTHGGSGIEELFVGSNAYKIASTSSRPVITVRSLQAIKSINKIVLPLDITFQTREKVPYTSKLANLFNAEIHIVTLRSTNAKSIVKKLKSYSDQVGSFFEAHKIPYKVENLKGGNLTDITLEYALSINADLISIMTEQEKSFSNLLLGNYAHQMINKALIPVLSFPTYQIGAILEDLRTQGIYIYDM